MARLMGRRPKMGGGGYARNWDLGAVVVALIATGLFLLALLSKPQVVILNHTVVVTQGLVVPAILVGALFWAMIEVLTKPGEGILDLIVRSVVGFVVGGLVGGLMGYTFNFGDYLLAPAFAGNYGAIWELVAILFLGIVLVWDAAWSHSRQYVRWG